jgi:hypothetical protein
MTTALNFTSHATALAAAACARVEGSLPRAGMPQLSHRRGIAPLTIDRSFTH